MVADQICAFAAISGFLGPTTNSNSACSTDGKAVHVTGIRLAD
jgi:hypothetical protein